MILTKKKSYRESMKTINGLTSQAHKTDLKSVNNKEEINFCIGWTLIKAIVHKRESEPNIFNKKRLFFPFVPF